MRRHKVRCRFCPHDREDRFALYYKPSKCFKAMVILADGQALWRIIESSATDCCEGEVWA